MDPTTARLKIEYYSKLLAQETNETKRQTILRLLAEEKAKLVSRESAVSVRFSAPFSARGGRCGQDRGQLQERAAHRIPSQGHLIQNSGPPCYVLVEGMNVRNSRVQGVSFDPETTGLLGRAYDRASEKIAPDKILREALAKRIIKAAMHGERDLEKLIEYGLGKDNLATLRNAGIQSEREPGKLQSNLEATR
jgi:hypothetical protein